ncbi:hypothetical protein ACW95P_04750, partial [Candidatus Mycoplasma pogonae]
MKNKKIKNKIFALVFLMAGVTLISACAAKENLQTSPEKPKNDNAFQKETSNLPKNETQNPKVGSDSTLSPNNLPANNP